MQTWLVHMRGPRQLLRDLGSAGAVTVQLIIGGNVLAALAHPIFVVGLAYTLLTKPALFAAKNISADALLFAATFISGYIASIVPSVIGLHRRRLLRNVWALGFVPVHWLLLSLAAWRALYQLIRDPHRWEKTDHGLAKTSRMPGADAPRSPDIAAAFTPSSVARIDTFLQSSQGSSVRIDASARAMSPLRHPGTSGRTDAAPRRRLRSRGM
jgi:hypothetical protein